MTEQNSIYQAHATESFIDVSNINLGGTEGISQSWVGKHDPAISAYSAAHSLPNIDEHEYAAWCTKYSELARLKVKKCITKDQEKEMGLLSWMLDTAEEKIGSHLKVLDGMVQERQRIARDIHNLIKQVHNIVPSKNNR